MIKVVGYQINKNNENYVNLDVVKVDEKYNGHVGDSVANVSVKSDSFVKYVKGKALPVELNLELRAKVVEGKHLSWYLSAPTL